MRWRDKRRRWCRVELSGESQGVEYMLLDQGKNKSVTCTAWSSTPSPYYLCARVLAEVTDSNGFTGLRREAASPPVGKGRE
jgi:hypothetical protein